MHSNKPLHRFTTVHGSTSTPAPSCRWAVTVPTITSVAGGAPEFTNFKVTALSENLANAWTGFYSVITMANAVISDVQTKCSNSVSERAKRTAIAEARLMRACAYFYMVRLWGPVIIIEDNDKSGCQIPCNRSTAKKMCWNSLFVTSLMQSRIFLKWQPPKDVSTHGGAKGMLAKVYLARSGWKGGTRDNADLGESQGTGRPT